MRDAIALREAEIREEKSSVVKMDHIPEFDIQDYDLMDSKDFGKYISTIENIARGSFEYRTLIQYLRENMDMNKCSIYEHVNNIDTSKVKIEIHHHPFTLYDIVVIVYNKRLFMREPIDDELVAKEVMYLHYSLLVGLIPLSETVHELVHNQYLFISNEKVMGKYEEFYNLYKEFMTPEIIDIYERSVDFSKSYDESRQNRILNKSYIYVDITGAFDIPTYQEVVNSMSDRIKEIKSGITVDITPEQPKKAKVISFATK